MGNIIHSIWECILKHGRSFPHAPVVFALCMPRDLHEVLAAAASGTDSIVRKKNKRFPLYKKREEADTDRWHENKALKVIVVEYCEFCVGMEPEMQTRTGILPLYFINQTDKYQMCKKKKKNLIKLTTYIFEKRILNVRVGGEKWKQPQQICLKGQGDTFLWKRFSKIISDV